MSNEQRLKKAASNKELKNTYDTVWKNDGFASFFTFSGFTQFKSILDMHNWEGLEVLEIGSGQGELGAMMIFAGAKKVDAVDFSEEATHIARESLNLPGLNCICDDYKNLKGSYDVVVMDGVLEHFDNPFPELRYITENFVKKDGYCITLSPSFLNPRGYVWMTLQLLFDVPMSLSDLHFLCPFDFEDFCKEHGYTLEYESADQDWGCGKRTIIDFKKRIKNALSDAGMYQEEKVDRFLKWLSRAVEYENFTEFSGANVTYKIGKG